MAEIHWGLAALNKLLQFYFQDGQNKTNYFWWVQGGKMNLNSKNLHITRDIRLAQIVLKSLHFLSTMLMTMSYNEICSFGVYYLPLRKW